MQMKAVGKLLRHSALLLIVLFAADRLIGMWLEHSFYRQRHGDDVVSTYVLEQAKEDVIIMGGSKASHDYKAAAIEKESGMSCFDGGRDNMDIIYTESMLASMLQRHAPKVLIIDVTHLDLADYGSGRRDNIQRLSTALLPYVNKHPELLPTVSLADRLEPVKAAISHVYPYNSLIGSIVQNTYTSFGHESEKGYEPLFRSIDSNTYKVPLWGWNVARAPVYPRSVAALNHVIRMSKDRNIRLIAIVSPFYFPLEIQQTEGYRLMQQTVISNGFEFYDFSRSRDFLHRPHYFDDDVHLNDSGAAAFSRQISGILRSGTLAH
jgi:hypothetical protein